MNRRQFLGAAGAAAAAPAVAVAADLQKQLRITGLETDVLHFPAGRVFYDAIHTMGGAHEGLVLRLQTNAGITGWAYSSLAVIPGSADALQQIVQKALKPILVGQDPAFPKRLRANMWQALEYAGVQGLNQFAISAAEDAVWDILGKAFQTPVYKLLGAYADRCPVYSMCGWYYPNDDDLSQFRKAIESAFDEGFSAAKIKVGRFSLQDDERRIKLAMQIAGPKRNIMVDANQKFDVAEAILRGKVYEEMGCYWYEEPTVPYDHAGYARIAEELEIRIAGGENEYTKYAFADLISRHCVDVVQPDGRRAGGVSEWMEIGALADAARLLIASHGGGPGDLQMLLAMPNAIAMESGSYRGRSNTIEQLHMVDSAVLAPVTPGMGTELRPEYVEKYKV
ncbi:MAG: mandelate racemase/muconate lactonizing enzyme family protein [Acidobacteriota bacterium]